ncbi:MAG: flagellar biosynthesis anti-sigma factor FlgM [bacterium]|nr:flagellar biosynthesis anti-sigma factor FlgM [bacterium]
MRIENALNEIRGSKPPEQRDAEVKRRKGTARSGDVVEISSAARSLGTQSVSKADLESVSDVRQARVEEVRGRVASGFYDRPEVRQAVADAILDSGAVDHVGQEAQQVRAVRNHVGDVPDVRTDRVEEARRRIVAGHYDSAGAQGETADRVLDALIG